MERDFKGIWIPAEVWLDDRLTPLDKIILVEIDSLDVRGEGCFASNAYLAEFCKCSETKISKSISLLAKLGYVDIVLFTGRSRKLQSRLAKNARQTCTNDKEPCKKDKALTSINNIDINIDDYIERDAPSLAEIKDYCVQKHLTIDPAVFYFHYTAVGWKIKGEEIKDWRALLKKWAINEYPDKPRRKNAPALSSYDIADIERLFIQDIQTGAEGK